MTDKRAMGRKKVFNDFYFNVGRALIQMEEETRRLLSEEQAQKPTAPAGLWYEMLALQAGYPHRWPQEMADKFNEVMSRYRPAPSSADEGLREDLERYALRFKNSNTCVGRLSVIWDDLSAILSRHPSTKSDRCAELVKRLRERSEEWFENGTPLQRIELDAILDEFEKDTDGKEGR